MFQLQACDPAANEGWKWRAQTENHGSPSKEQLDFPPEPVLRLAGQKEFVFLRLNGPDLAFQTKQGKLVDQNLDAHEMGMS